MKKLSYLFLITIIAVSCADKIDSNLNQTGLIDQNGNLITNTLVKTNILHFTGNIPAWSTNLNVDYVFITNSNGVEIKYEENILSPNLPDKPTDYYKIYVPYGVSGDGYITVSYKDTNKLNQLWFDQINRKAYNDGKVFAIRNKENNRDENNFQNRHAQGNYTAQDYYYFNDNGDIVWKEDNRIIKKFVGAIVTEYRDVNKYFGDWSGGWGGAEWAGYPHGYAIKEYKWKQRGVLTVGGVYANTLTTEDARRIYIGRARGDRYLDEGDDPFKDGVFNFITYRQRIETFNNGFALAANMFERQYITQNFIEIFVMDPEDNLGYENAAGVYSYYAYFAKFSYVEGFTSENRPYMTNQKIYLAQRPEYTTPLLTHSAAFTDGHRHPKWHFLFMPGHKN